MMRFALGLCAAGALAALAWGQAIRPGEVNGGGTIAYASTLRLAGVITGQGVGGGAAAGVSQNSSYKVSSGFYPAVGPLVIRHNLADPAWLKVARGQTDRGALELTAWREPETSPQSFDLTGWQL